jgi:putative tryptophan/tyrosine transport system substrate-binding protein
MKRREFITLLGGAAAGWPLAARAQQTVRMRRIGVLMNVPADDPIAQARFNAFVRGLGQLGWTDGRNMTIDVRWGAPEAGRYRSDAAELVTLKPEVLLAASGATMPALTEATRTIPIVFLLVPDPVGSGFVESLARPGGNATGFTPFEFGISGKWLELLKELAPRVTRAGILRDPVDPAGIGQFGAIRTAAPAVGIDVRPIDVRDREAIERGIDAFASAANAGLVVTGSSPAGAHRNLIIALAARHRLPAVYAYSNWPKDGGLIAYGPDQIDQYRQAAGYVDRILKGEKPADLPVQAPTKYETVINLKTAKALGLTVPPTLLARADEVIE